MEKTYVQILKKIFVSVLAAGFAILVLLLAVGRIRSIYVDTKYSNFYHNISDASILSHRDDYTAKGKLITTPDGVKKHEFAASDFVRFSADRFDGLLTASQFAADGETIRLTVKSTLKSGNLRIFIIKNHTEILQEIAPNEEITLDLTCTESDTYTIRALGIAADMTLEVSHTAEKGA